LLCPRDPADAVLAGAPRDLVGRGWSPGRAVLLERAGAHVAHVARARPAPERWRESDLHPVRLQRLPREVELPSDMPGGAGSAGVPEPQEEADVTTDGASGVRVWLGRGGDGAQWMYRSLFPGHTWLVCGPGGSGRSTALAAMVHQLREQGRQVLGPEDLPGSAPKANRPGVLMVDDADRLGATAVQACTAYLQQCDETAVLATARSEGLVTAHHALAMHLREADLTIVLAE